jgi:hypothetical protein
MSAAGVTRTGDVPCWSCRMDCPSGCGCLCHPRLSTDTAALYDALNEILNLTPRAICGESLVADDDSADPTPDSPVCADCCGRRRPVTGLRTAYLNLCYRFPAASLLILLAFLCASISGLLVAVWLHTELMWIPVGFLVADVLLINFAPGDDENGGDS